MKFISKDISKFQDYNRKGYNKVYKQNNQYFQLNSHVLQIICEGIPATKDNLIIDIGCGQGYLIEHLCKLGYYCHAADVSGVGISQLKKSLDKSDKHNLLAKAGNVDNLKLTSQYSAIVSTRLINYLTEIQSLTLIKKF